MSSEELTTVSLKAVTPEQKRDLIWQKVVTYQEQCHRGKG